ncbi:sigma-54-dependent Fis family transcriptional regulator [Candidatus Desantisbacteria bacterium]|nr:sigma-54-dependent Fis family transcriptional regulator [Candidatus Desantisbacteria bacterium]
MQNKTNILIIDDEKSIIEGIRLFLAKDYDVLVATNGEDGLKQVNEKRPSVVLLDVMLPDINGIEVLHRIKNIDESIEVIMFTGVNDMRTTVDALQLGAFDYCLKPFDINELSIVVKKALENQGMKKEIKYRRLLETQQSAAFDNIIGESIQMRQVYEVMNVMSRSDTTILITGESGTGKGIIARAIHFKGTRSNMPFIAVNCSSIPGSMIENELFGYEKGAFAGAAEQKIGKLELAHQGTIFLDEIGSLKPNIQAKILKVLQEKEIQRIGGTHSVKIDVRVIAATSSDLQEAVKKGLFREELYYRLNIVPIHMPPLRERKEDIPALVNYFLNLYKQKFNKEIKGISVHAMTILEEYYWPGNVQELKNIIERVVSLTKEGEMITHQNLPIDLLITKGKIETEGITLKEARNQFEKQFITHVLERVKWNQIKASTLLDIHRNTLLLKIQQLGIKLKQPVEEQTEGNAEV